MKQKFLLIIIYIMLSVSPLFAQHDYTFKQFFNETFDFVKQPLKWEGDDYLKIGLICGGTGLIMFTDQTIRDGVLRDGKYYISGDQIPVNRKIGDPIPGTQKHFYNPVIVFGRMYGELYSPIVFFSGFAIYSLIADDIWARKVAYEIGQASLYAGGLTFLLKMAIGRARPYMEEGSASYHPFSSIFIQDNHSLPGGHSTAAFTISTILARNVDQTWLKVVFYVPAVLTMVSRVYQDQHWTSDNVMGAALGYFIATWVVDQHEKPIKSDSKETGQNLWQRIQIQPYIMGNFYGLNLNFRLL